VNQNGIAIDSNYPIRIEFSPMHDELYVCTKYDVRCIDIHSGQVKRIIANLIDAEDEIGDIRLFFDQNNFIVANSAGKLRLHSIVNGSVRKELVSHRREVTDIVLDE
jgi:hypothetical protein